MKKIVVLTLFKNLFTEFINTSVIGRAIENKLVDISIIDIRDFSLDKHKRVDFPPYGGGAGMVLSPLPLDEAIKYAKSIIGEDTNIEIIYMSPRGKVLNYNVSNEYAKKDYNYIIICGHYEGIDERIIEKYNACEISIGDYVLTGGELASQVFMDSVIRLIPNVIDKDSLLEESHTINLLEYPQYTKPDDFCGMMVPEILKSGNHKKIDEFRRQEAIRITKKYRPDILKRYEEEGK